MDTKNPKARGRPRKFDEEQALATAQALFHARGYDDVSVADLTAALGINPPSFYAAFGSKAQLFERVLARYVASTPVPLSPILAQDRPASEALAQMLRAYAAQYAEDPTAPGCMVLAGQSAVDPTARAAACGFGLEAMERVRAFVARSRPADAARIADYVGVVLSGMSAAARSGMDRARLLEVAKIAAVALADLDR